MNERVPPNVFYEEGLELQDDSPMTIGYRKALQAALDEVTQEEGVAALCTPKGANVVIEQFVGTNFEKVGLLGH